MMNKELKKRIFTSIILLSLLTAMYFYTFIMIGSMMIIAIITWIEFYALISKIIKGNRYCLLYTSPSPRDRQKSRMPSSA